MFGCCSGCPLVCLLAPIQRSVTVAHLYNLISLPFVSNGLSFFPLSCFPLYHCLMHPCIFHSVSIIPFLYNCCHVHTALPSLYCVYFKCPLPIHSLSYFLLTFPFSSRFSFCSSLTELFQRRLEYIWLCDSSGQHHWHPGDRAWGKYRNLPCVFRSILKTVNCNQADMILVTFNDMSVVQVWLTGRWGSACLWACTSVPLSQKHTVDKQGR